MPLPGTRMVALEPACRSYCGVNAFADRKALQTSLIWVIFSFPPCVLVKYITIVSQKWQNPTAGRVHVAVRWRSHMQTGMAAVSDHQRLSSASASLIAWIVFSVAISGLKQSEAIGTFCSPASTTQALFFYTFSSNYNDDSSPHSLMAPGGVTGLTTRAVKEQEWS